jgi:hypothetical protein
MSWRPEKWRESSESPGGSGTRGLFLLGWQRRNTWACRCGAGRGDGGTQQGDAPGGQLPFFLIDDLGRQDLGCYGSTFYETPNIDRLAAQGMRFTNAYAACPVCSPTRASIMTGKYPARILTNYIAGARPASCSRPSISII